MAMMLGRNMVNEGGRSFLPLDGNACVVRSPQGHGCCGLQWLCMQQTLCLAGILWKLLNFSTFVTFFVLALHSAQFFTQMWQLIVWNNLLLRTQNMSLITWSNLCIFGRWFRIWAYFLLEMPHFAKKCNSLFSKILKSKFTFLSVFNFTNFSP